MKNQRAATATMNIRMQTKQSFSSTWRMPSRRGLNELEVIIGSVVALLQRSAFPVQHPRGASQMAFASIPPTNRPLALAGVTLRPGNIPSGFSS